MAEIATESGHWYKKDGTPCYEIEYADKKRKGEFRPTTLRDARKLSLVPSVTTITRILSKPQLDIWKQKQLLESAYTCPLRRDEVTAEEWMARVKADGEEQAKIARDKGTVIHGEVEKFIKGDKVEAEYLTRCVKVMAELVGYGIVASDVEIEKSFATDKYGGKIDIMVRNGKNFIADIKTTEFTLVDGVPFKNGKKAKLNYDDHILQLSAYARPNFLEMPDLVNIYVSSIDNSVYVHKWTVEDYYKAWSRFELLVDLWWKTNF